MESGGPDTLNARFKPVISYFIEKMKKQIERSQFHEALITYQEVDYLKSCMEKPFRNEFLELKAMKEQAELNMTATPK